jgi:hypothetical protein
VYVYVSVFLRLLTRRVLYFTALYNTSFTISFTSIYPNRLSFRSFRLPMAGFANFQCRSPEILVSTCQESKQKNSSNNFYGSHVPAGQSTGKWLYATCYIAAALPTFMVHRFSYPGLCSVLRTRAIFCFVWFE